MEQSPNSILVAKRQQLNFLPTRDAPHGVRWGKGSREGVAGSGVFLVCGALFPMVSLEWAGVKFVLGVTLIQHPWIFLPLAFYLG